CGSLLRRGYDRSSSPEAQRAFRPRSHAVQYLSDVWRRRGNPESLRQGDSAALPVTASHAICVSPGRQESAAPTAEANLHTPMPHPWIFENVPLAPFTTLGIGGPARFLAHATEESRVLEALDFADSRGVPLFILGGGSNILISDAGHPGLVLHIA